MTSTEKLLLDKEHSLVTETDLEGLIKTLSEARDIYYGRAEDPDLVSPLSDRAYDSNLEYLEGFEKDFPKLFEEGTPGWRLLDKNGAFLEVEEEKGLATKRGRATIRHSLPMLSLAKAKNSMELESFYNKISAKGSDSFKVQSKLDGFALSLVYRDSKLSSIASRGSGQLGDDYSFLLEASKNDPNFTLIGLPATIETDLPYLELRGEIIIKKAELEATNKDRASRGQPTFKNERNAIVGIIKKAEKGLDYKATVHFICYSSIVEADPSKPGFGYLYQELSELDEAARRDLLTVDQLTQEALGEDLKISGLKTFRELEEVLYTFESKMQGFPYLVDGAVLKPTKEAELNNREGATSHHPVTQLAYKFPGETALTRVLEITVSVGRTGSLTPKALLEPVDLKQEAVRISNVTLHNFAWIAERDLRVGSVVAITRSGSVIPYLKKVLPTPLTSPAFPIPTHCPVCECSLTYTEGKKSANCTNEDCASRNLYALYAAVNKGNLDIHGLAEKVIDNLVEQGKLSDIADLFTLSLSDLSSAVSGYNSSTGAPILLGELRAKKILEAIKKAQKETPLEKALTSLNIKDLGTSSVREILKIAPRIEDLLALTEEDLKALPLFGELKATSLVKGLSSRKPLIEKLQSVGFIFNERQDLEVKASEDLSEKEQKLQGLTFLVSGEVPEGFKNRADFIAYLTERGALAHSSVKKDTQLLIADPEGTSSKVKKALALGVPIVTPQDFRETYLDF